MLQVWPLKKKRKKEKEKNAIDFIIHKFTVFSSSFPFFFFGLFMATPMAYGSSQAKGRIRAVVAGLRQSNSNARSKLHLQPIPQLMATWILPLHEARDRTCILMDASQIHFHWATTETPCIPFFFFFVFLSFSRSVPEACGGSKAMGPIEAVSTGLHHSHSNARSEPRLRPTPQLVAMPNP